MSAINRNLQWWRDWRSDGGLRQVSLAARGLWMEMLCLMHDADPYGHLLIAGRPLTTLQLAKAVSESPEVVSSLLEELEDGRVFSRNGDGVIFCRRLVRDREAYLVASANGRKGGNPNLTGRRPPDDSRRQVKATLKVESKEVSKEERVHEASLHGAKAPQPAGDLFGDRPQPEPKPVTAQSLLFSEGLAIISELTDKPPPKCRPLLGTFRKAAGNDDERLLQVLRECLAKPPASLESWVLGCLKAPKLVVNNVPADPDDLWGINGFCASMPDAMKATEGEERQYGKWCLDGTWMFDATAKRVATAARLPAARAIDWTLLVQWLRDGFKLDRHIEPTLVYLAGVFDQPATSLLVFDKTLRNRRAA